MLAERLVAELTEPFQISGHEVVVGASIGIALAPRDGSNADLLLKNADMALYRAKSDGRRAWRFFENGMDVMAQARRNLQLDLRSALASNAFEIHYQPLLNLHTKTDFDLRGVAALAASGARHGLAGGIHSRGRGNGADRRDRQLRPARGMPGVRQVARRCPRGRQHVADPVPARQRRRGHTRGAFRREPAGKPARDRDTESVFLNDTDLTRHWLDELQEMGVRISLDDFGTGYSSLSYLHNYPLNKVKIDRSFLQGVDTSHRSLNLLRSVARLSADLGMSVAVEGIETEEQFDLVAQETSVEEVQGFLFGAAMPSSDIRSVLFAPPARISKVA